MTMMECGCAANAKRKTPDGYVDCCVTHNTIVQVREPDLTGRQAKCCSEKTIRPSSTDLAFFEYRGVGSRSAKEHCKNCGYYESAHKKEGVKGTCGNFEPHGPYEFDRYYCGCRGWD